jgi:hypothetical protein
VRQGCLRAQERADVCFGEATVPAAGSGGLETAEPVPPADRLRGHPAELGDLAWGEQADAADQGRHGVLTSLRMLSGMNDL